MIETPNAALNERGEVSCVDGATAASVTAIGCAMARSTLTPWRRRLHSGALAGVAPVRVLANTCAGRLARCVLACPRRRRNVRWGPGLVEAASRTRNGAEMNRPFRFAGGLFR